MASTYVNDLRLNEMATGDASGTWGTTTNTNLELIAEAFSYGTEAITTNADTHTTTIADGATDPGRSMFLKYTGTLDSTCTITIGPNTVSKLWIIENGTSGSQSIIIKQGSGATVTIPSGKTKVIYSDGAGSGGAMVDAFASLNLQTSGIIESSSSIQTPLIEYTDGDDAMTIADGGQVTFAQNIIGTLGTAAQANITSLGTLTTLTVDDITINGSTISDAGDFTLDVGGDIILDADGSTISMKDGGTNRITFNLDATPDLVMAGGNASITASTSDADLSFIGNDGGSDVTALTLDMSEAGAATFNNKIIATELDISGDIDVDGTTNLDVVDIDGAVDMASTLGVTGVVTANAGVVVDNFTLDGTTLALSSGDLTLDAAGRIDLSADDNGEVRLFDGSLHYGQFKEDGNNFIIQSVVADADIHIQGLDDSSVISALAFDMSQAGRATFNEGIVCKSSTGGDFGVNINTASGDSLTLQVVDTGTGGAANGVITVSDGDLILSPSANVGIGTTSPGMILDVDGSSGANDIARFSGPNSGGLTFRNATANEFIIHTATSDALIFGTGGNNERMRIDSSGNVGIGTTSPDFLLEVETGSTSVAPKLGFRNTQAGTQIGMPANTNALSFTTGDSERMRIDSSGRLLLGTTSKISGDQGNAGYLAVHGNTDASGSICEVKNTGNPASNRDFIRFFNSSDGEAGSIEHNGTSSVAYNTSSDYRLKENIEPLANGLQRLLQLNPVQFDWKSDKTSSEGFIAHEVQEIFSDAISGEKDGEQTQGMDYGRITPLLVKAIQEQQTQIDALQSEIKILKGE